MGQSERDRADRAAETPPGQNGRDPTRPAGPAVVTDLDLAERILASGLDAGTFDRLARLPDGFQRLFGERALLKVEFDVAGFGEHSHLVYIPPAGADPEIISAYPEDGRLRVTPPMAWAGHVHSPFRHPVRRQRVAVIDDAFAPADWRALGRVAARIDASRLNYNFLFQNSNSVVATLLAAAGLAFTDLKGGGLNFGAGNTLVDEMQGGRQVPRLLVRGGTSFSGPATSRLPGPGADLDTDA